MSELATEFLPPGREERELLLPLACRFKQSLTARLFDVLPLGIVILNVDRQVVYCNAPFRSLADEVGVEDVVGLRPGEALGCIHSDLQDGGCGTTRFCRQCGAAIAILESFQGENGIEECLMQRRVQNRDDSLVLQVFTAPFTYEDQDFVLFSALDIRHEKRAHEMERLVFHRLLNSASGMVMLSNLIEEEATSEVAEYTAPLRDAAKGLVGMIRNQQVWAAAEQGRLRVLPERVLPDNMLRQVLLEASSRDSDREWHCALDCSCEKELRTDPDLLRLVLNVFLENAFEAMPRGSLVMLGCSEEAGLFTFFVCNEGIPSEDIRNQFFKRSFSTKGQGRGFGLHRARLLARHYLGGEVGVSCEDGRTTFFVTLPKEIAGKE